MLTAYPNIQTSKRLVEESVFHYLKFMSSLPCIEIHEEQDAFYVFADAPVLYLNSVVRARFHGNAKQGIESAKKFFRQRHSNSLTWFITPSLEPEDLGELIMAQGGEPLKSVPYLAVHLDDLPHDFPVPSNFGWKPVRTHKQLASWTFIYCHARGSEASVDRLFNVFAVLDLTETSPLQLVLVYLSGEPVATYSIFMDHEIAGFYSLSRLPEARGHGIGTAIYVVTADLAQEYGYETAMLISDPPSRNICKRLGFVDGFGYMDIYGLSI